MMRRKPPKLHESGTQAMPQSASSCRCVPLRSLFRRGRGKDLDKSSQNGQAPEPISHPVVVQEALVEDQAPAEPARTYLQPPKAPIASPTPSPPSEDIGLTLPLPDSPILPPAFNVPLERLPDQDILDEPADEAAVAAAGEEDQPHLRLDDMEPPSQLLMLGEERIVELTGLLDSGRLDDLLEEGGLPSSPHETTPPKPASPQPSLSPSRVNFIAGGVGKALDDDLLSNGTFLDNVEEEEPPQATPVMVIPPLSPTSTPEMRRLEASQQNRQAAGAAAEEAAGDATRQRKRRDHLKDFRDGWQRFVKRGREMMTPAKVRQRSKRPAKDRAADASAGGGEAAKAHPRQASIWDFLAGRSYTQSLSSSNSRPGVCWSMFVHNDSPPPDTGEENFDRTAHTQYYDKAEEPSHSLFLHTEAVKLKREEATSAAEPASPAAADRTAPLEAMSDGSPRDSETGGFIRCFSRVRRKSSGTFTERGSSRDIRDGSGVGLGVGLGVGDSPGRQPHANDPLRGFLASLPDLESLTPRQVVNHLEDIKKEFLSHYEAEKGLTADRLYGLLIKRVEGAQALADKQRWLEPEKDKLNEWIETFRSEPILKLAERKFQVWDMSVDHYKLMKRMEPTEENRKGVDIDPNDWSQLEPILRLAENPDEQPVYPKPEPTNDPQSPQHHHGRGHRHHKRGFGLTHKQRTRGGPTSPEAQHNLTLEELQEKYPAHAWTESIGNKQRKFHYRYRPEPDRSVTTICKGFIPKNTYDVVQIINDKQEQWAPFCHRARKLKSLDRVTQVIQQLYKLPWPLNNRDTIIFGYGNDALDELNTLVLVCVSPDEWVDKETNMFHGVHVPPEGKAMPRVPIRSLLFFLKPCGPDGTILEVYSNVDPGISHVPMFIITEITRRIVVRMFKHIIEACKTFKGESNPQLEFLRARLADVVERKGRPPPLKHNEPAAEGG
ncbi:unnamed protein product [Vitrella brassicaformis CCMP3155]|uniref:START domain-containing protein n=2 Tax=Vitrella brassicaformis TaxID=1169539 RepID=A0A0G4G551_VITBC|nr:unnamed protein product [Vitrella brassicaformis CCMP3155]|eukprot:CEM23642.1 unnamed protein product [Vitrella brassicaformis CCMP3155]